MWRSRRVPRSGLAPASLRPGSVTSVAEIVAVEPLVAAVPHPLARRLARSHRLHAAELAFDVPTIDVGLSRTRVNASDPALAWLATTLGELFATIEEFRA